MWLRNIKPLVGPVQLLQSLLVIMLITQTAGGAEEKLLESQGETVSQLLQEIEGPFDPAYAMRFQGQVALLDPEPLRKPTVTNTRDLNFDAELACLVIRQFDAAGQELAADASMPAWQPGETALTVEAAPLPGVARVRLECRLSGIKAVARFSELKFMPQAARLHLPPQASVVTHDGKAPQIVIKDVPFPSLIAHGQNLETSANADASLRDLRLPYQHGLRLLSFNAWFAGVTRQNPTENLQRLAAEFPDAHFLVRLWLGPRGSFFEDYPEERAVFDDGSHTSPSIGGSESSRLQRYMAAAVRRLALDLRKSPAARQLAGFIPMYFLTGEWQYADASSPMIPETQDYRMVGFDENHRSTFAQWALRKYGDLAALNTAWGTGYADAAEVAVPTAAERRHGDLGDFRDPATQQRVVDFARFHSASVAQMIIRSAQQIEQAFHGRVVTGPFYGYALEHSWSTTGPQQQGHLALGQLLRSPTLDFHGGPYSYNSDNRAFGLPVDTNAVLDSAALHQKLAFLEEDTYTHIARSPGEQFFAPGEHLKTKSLEETLAVLRRNLGVALARGYALYWMGLLEDDRFSLPEIWEAYDPVFTWLKTHATRPAFEPQIALVVDEEALSLLAEKSRAVTGRWLYELRSRLARIDTTLGIYLQSDLERIPQSVRMLVLATPYQITPTQRDALQSRWMRDGRTIVFCHLADAFDSDGEKAHLGEITGIAMHKVAKARQPLSIVEPGAVPGVPDETLFGAPQDRSAIFWRPQATLPPINPHVVVDDPGVRVLARYQNDKSQAASVALRKLPGWTSAWTAVHSLPPAMWRWLAGQAGAHLYLEEPSQDFEQPDVVEATEDFFMLVSGRDGTRHVQMPEGVEEMQEIGGAEERLVPREGTFALTCKSGVPRLFSLVAEAGESTPAQQPER